MNQKRAKALRKLVTQLAKQKNLPDHSFKNMMLGDKTKSLLTVAGDTKRGQYIALKSMIKQQYKG